MRRPNIVQITCHDLGRHLGCYGVETVHTPTLERLAAGGVRFANSFCTSPGCSPSRAALATGRYPHQNGVLGLAHAHFGWQLGPEEQHTARLLGEAGYHTGLFGLQHVTFNIGSLGFHQIHAGRPADEVAANVDRFLKGSPGQPFYAEINFFEPHRPFDFGGVAADMDRGVYVPPYLPDCDASRQEFGLMQGAIRKVDDSVAQIRASLERAGVWDDTLLLFTADHGVAFPRAKGTLYDAGIEVALIAHWPNGGLANGTVADASVSNVDVVPTYLEIAVAPARQTVEGHSFLPVLRGQSTGQREAVFAEKTFHNEYDPMRCIRTATHKLIVHLEVANRIEAPADIMMGPTYKAAVNDLMAGRGMLELYDLVQDPWEQENLSLREEHGELLRDLGRRLYQWMDDTDDPLLRGAVASPFYYRAVDTLRNF